MPETIRQTWAGEQYEQYEQSLMLKEEREADRLHDLRPKPPKQLKFNASAVYRYTQHLKPTFSRLSRVPACA